MTLREMIDLPPVWLAAAVAVVWGIGRLFPVEIMGPGFARLGGLLITLGLLLIAVAAWQMWRHRTTIIPRLRPARLLTNGVFGLTRNPIYLGDALILGGLILRWDAVLALPVLVAFVAVIQRRFILPEEAMLRRLFGTEFDAYCARTRRWIGGSGWARLRAGK